MPLQKSYSGPNRSAKSKQQQRQWNRTKTDPGPQPANPTAKPLQEKPALPVSTATKNKLHGFQFEGKPEKKTSGAGVIDLVSDNEKENGFARSNKMGENVQEKANVASGDNSILSELTAKRAPSTPAAKVALPDLIGMGDVRRDVESVSPDERIVWEHDKDVLPLGTSSSFGGTRRARKRARSSSPATPGRASGQLLSKLTPNPQVDPASELWGRYSLNAPASATPQGPAVPAFAQILQHTSSPQPSRESATPRSVAGFRRANSCGNQFPKRRRIGGSDRDDVFVEAANIGPSRLSVLIERVQEGLTQPRPARLVGTSKSSSSQKRSHQTTEDNPQTASPETLSQDGIPDPSPETLVKEDLPTAADEVPLPQSSPGHADCESSDYGDFDDDDLDATLLQLDYQSQQVLEKATPGAVAPKPKIRTSPVKATSQRQANIIPSEVSASILSGAEKDEFDDSDVDMSETDLRHIASTFDAQAARRAQSAVPMAGVIPRQTAMAEVADSESEDEFRDDGLDDFDFEAAEATATQSIQQVVNSLLPSTQKIKAQAIQRYLVTNILESEFEAPNGRKQNERILLLQIEREKTTRVVHLRGGWFETPVTVKAFVHLIGAFDSNGRCVVDDNNNLLILHPDHLISSTVVADSFGCVRRAVLQDRVKATSESSPPLVYGTILHEIFQAAMIENRWDTAWLYELIETIATRHLEDLYTIRLQISQAVEYLRSKMTELQAWAELFICSRPNPGALVKTAKGEKAAMCVSKLLDVEEHVWSPMYGLKGNIDATVQVTMQDGVHLRTLTVPFEVKTGKNPSAAHRAQTALYNLLLSDRYDVEIAYGILYYMETSETIRIPAIRNELRHMIMKRNELACYVRERHAELPEMLKKENMCNRCYAKTPCFIYHKLADDGDGMTSGMHAKFDEVVKHLTPKHKEFFMKWDGLLTKEEKESLRFRRELWTMLSSEREKLGRCFSTVIIEPGSAYEDQANPKINRYTYNLIKQEAPSGFSFLDSQITVGEPIVISDEKGHFALANGYVTHVRKRRIAVAVDRRLHNARIRQLGFDEHDNQVFSSIMQVTPEGSSVEDSQAKVPENPMTYRLDKDEFSNGMATVRNNLIQVMADGPNAPFGSRQIRGLIVDLNAPRFKSQASAYTLRDRENINIDQRRAIQKVMSAEDYALVLGMPGTGKTTTIAHIIRALVSQGKSVLLTSYTHTAVDNILLKLKDDGMPILRLGTIAKISPEVQEFAVLAATTKNSFDEIRDAWHKTPIVATTCLGINHAIFNERTFDYCIVDEASQITLPVCLGPIRLARTFILVGDHNQLPPLVQNEEARTGGLDVSLFKHLSDMHPSSVVCLEHQYRMCADVMALSNNLIYNGRLKCGSEAVATRSIVIPDMDALKNHHFSPSTLSRSQKSMCAGAARHKCWIRDLLDPETKVAFINTDPLGDLAREEAKGNRIVNPTEATICTQLVLSLLTVGVPASEIGVMTHYRSQLSLLKHSLRSHPDVEMHTADRFQGRDKEVIVLSLVRNNEARSIGELLKDWRRINVAFTRAKTKLLVIGSRGTLMGNGFTDGEEDMLAKVVKLMESKNWIFDMPVRALGEHYFVEGGTQATQITNGSPIKKSPCKNSPGSAKKRKLSLSENKENSPGSRRPALGIDIGTGGNSRRMPKKKIMGQKPFKVPRMGVLADVVNEALG